MPSLTATEPWFVYGVIAIVLLLAVISIMFIQTAISGSTFSLGEALSEEVTVTLMKKDAGGQDVPDKDASGNPIDRKPTSAAESFKMAIPGLRQQVPRRIQDENK